ncbi:VIN3-like protein 1 [Platanthera zijinensis]|uniref:VIN3-like protein 1 n=1 Tax=Platanthera zijinensis TaxID=2320716 RepID=A0AAP0B9J5_9ASPA
MVVSDDKVVPTALDTSSSAVSASRENGKSHEIITVQNLNEFLNFYPKNQLLHTILHKENKRLNLSKCKASVELSKSTLRCKELESMKNSSHSTSRNSQSSKKQPRKCDNPVRLSITECSDHARILYCENSACKAILSSEDRFCRKCSCSICHLYDDNMDPTQWLVCTAESGDGYLCGVSCHIECALQQKRTGVVDHGQFMQLDGSYCCASCGKVSGIIECWKKQLTVAKDAQQVGILCYRLSLSYRLLNGTSKFKELHKIVEDMMKLLEPEVGLVNGVSASIARGIVSRLSVASDVQNKCFLAIEKADACLNPVGGSNINHRDSLHFEEISCSSLVIVLNKQLPSESDAIDGYKLSYRKSTEQIYKKDSVLIPRSQLRIFVSNLQPSSDYVFRVSSFSDDRELCYTESKCSTRSAENTNAQSSMFKVRSLGRAFEPVWTHEEYDAEEESYIGSGASKPINTEEDQPKASVPCQLDLNVATVPDLNADIMESSPEENRCSLDKNRLESSNGGAGGSVPNGHVDGGDVDSTLVSAPPPEFSCGLSQMDDDYEYCVKVIRRLECSGHIQKEFRMKFLTWFSLRATEQERWVVITFIRTLIEEPSSLAGQLLDTFLETVNCKRLRNGFCVKLWH